MKKAVMQFWNLFKKKPTSSQREAFLRFLPKNSIGAEIGVFKGEFSIWLIKIVKPKKLHLIDVWWTEFGEYYPDWGDYTDYGKLKTRDAFNIAKTSLAPYPSVQFHVENSTECLQHFKDHYFDWVYLDSSHAYEDTIKELVILQSKIKKEGFILGHDWRPDPDHMHHGVYKAVNEFMINHSYELVKLDDHLQWCIRKKI